MNYFRKLVTEDMKALRSCLRKHTDGRASPVSTSDKKGPCYLVSVKDIQAERIELDLGAKKINTIAVNDRVHAPEKHPGDREPFIVGAGQTITVKVCDLEFSGDVLLHYCVDAPPDWTHPRA